MVINGQTYSTQAGLGDTLATSSVITLVNQSNPSQTVELTTGSTTDGTSGQAATLATTSDAAAFQTALESALGISSTNAALTFQVGSTSSDTIGVSLQSVSSNTLFDGVAQNVSTASAAATAYTAVTDALNTIGSARASVGALELEFQYASAAAQSGSQNEAAAASDLLNTNVASTSTQFSTDQVVEQAGISVLAQANQLPQDALKLLQ
jgi:flagellin